jgi:hypothetical protein
MPFADDYNTVPERIVEFRAKYPEGTLQRVGDLQLIEVDGKTFLAYTAAAYRTPDDPRPGIGTAWEPVPGLTNFTKNSELQNAETSAWGRAIIAVGAADAKKGIASQEDVQARQAEQEQRAAADAAIPGLRSSIEAAIGRLDDGQKVDLKAWFAEVNLPPVRRMNADQCDRVLDHLMSLPDRQPTYDDPDVRAEPEAVQA